MSTKKKAAAGGEKPVTRQGVAKALRKLKAQPAQLTPGEIQMIDRAYRADGEFMRRALACLAVPGGEFIDKVTNARQEDAQLFARVERDSKEFAERLRGLAHMCEVASLRCTLALAHRKDGDALREAATPEVLR